VVRIIQAEASKAKQIFERNAFHFVRFPSSLLKNAKKNDGSGSESITRLSGTGNDGSRAVIGGGDGNSRNYAVKGMKGSGQD